MISADYPELLQTVVMRRN